MRLKRTICFNSLGFTFLICKTRDEIKWSPMNLTNLVWNLLYLTGLRSPIYPNHSLSQLHHSSSIYYVLGPERQRQTEQSVPVLTARRDFRFCWAQPNHFVAKETGPEVETCLGSHGL